MNTMDNTRTVATVAMSIIPIFQPKEETAKIEGFVEETMPMYSVDDFRSHFRMSRSTFDVSLLLHVTFFSSDILAWSYLQKSWPW